MTGALLAQPPVRPSTLEVLDVAQRTCSIEGCERPSKARGWCGTHYARWSRTGTTDPPTELGPPRRIADGQRFSRLLVLWCLPGRGRRVYHVLCDCGVQKNVPGQHLQRGQVVSCGCYQREVAAARVREGSLKGPDRPDPDPHHPKLGVLDMDPHEMPYFAWLAICAQGGGG